MNVGSLFSGVGGIELGFERAGFRTVWCVEIDPYARAILKKRFPDAAIFEDITSVDFTKVPRVDIITGGFPCQDISNAGKRVGIAGSRSGLWKEYARAIREIRPKYAVIENVAALVNRGLAVVLADLHEIGYAAEWYNLSASAVGALHRRERIFIICYPNDDGQSSPKKRIGTLSRSDDNTQRQETTCKLTRSNYQYTNVADTACEREEWRITERNRNGKPKGTFGNGSHRADVSNTEGDGRRQGEFVVDAKILRQDKQSRQSESECSEELRWNTTIGQWAVEPAVGRVADGIPNRVDRIKCLGNAVVPQCAEVIAEAIREYEMNKGEGALE